jgi:hypothetical protein
MECGTASPIQNSSLNIRKPSFVKKITPFLSYIPQKGK